LPIIKNIQPHGPYRLGGYCLGAVVAFETARLLAAAGEDVEMVLMFDNPTLNARRSVQTVLSLLTYVQPIAARFLERTKRLTWYVMAMQSPGRLPWIKSRLRIKVSAALKGEKGRADPATNPTTFEQPINLDRTQKYARAMSNYMPAPLAVPVVYFSARHDATAWSRISPNVEEIKLSDGHDEVVADPTDLAQHLRTILQRKGHSKPAPMLLNTIREPVVDPMKQSDVPRGR